MAEPGWYPDTSMTGTQRYWDGARWTEHVAPLATPAGAFSAQPRRKADGTVKGPSLGTALGLLALGLLLGISSLIVVVPAFIDSVSGPRWQVPGSHRTHLDDGEWLLYERVGLASFGRIDAADVTVVGPSTVVAQYTATHQTITINEREYVAVVRFEVETPGTYDITVRGEPSNGGEVLLSRPIWDLFERWPWFIAGVAGGLLSAIGVVLWIVGGVNRGRAKRAMQPGTSAPR